MKERVVIVGGGLGGLFSGAFLAKNGYDVTVLEKNVIIGGGLQCFTRKGKTFEAGMHILGGFQDGGSLYKICNYLGILPLLDIEHVDPACIDEVYFESTGETYKIGGGKEGFIKSLSAYFPDEENGIRKYVDRLWSLSAELPLYFLKDDCKTLTTHSEEQLWAADKFISTFISDPKLRSLLAYLNPLYGGEAGHTPNFIHALINKLFIEGSSRFRGGSQQLADALKCVIESFGGKVINNSKVQRIDVENHRATSVVTARGTSYECDHVIFSLHPSALSHMLPAHTLRPGYIKRVDTAPNTYSAFSVYIDLKPGKFPNIPHPCYYLDDYDVMWNQGNCNCGSTSKAFIYLTPAEHTGSSFANRLIVYSPLLYKEVQQWENTSVGKRGKEYETWKQSYADGIIEKLESRHPGLKDAIENIYTSTPLTIRDFYGTKEGSVFGIRKDCQNIMFSHIPIRTRVKNLIMTGQNINLHGICGVPLTAIQTCESLMGTNTLRHLINEANNN